MARQKSQNQRMETLNHYYQHLPKEQQATLLEYAEFLHGKYGTKQKVKETINPVQAPEGENVVQAMKRLSRTYPMLDKTIMLGPASDLLSQNLIHGKNAGEVIEKLEKLFLDEYNKL